MLAEAASPLSYPFHADHSASWLNLIKHWFREIIDKRIRRGSFRNVEELTGATMDYIERHNENFQRFVWTAKAQTILKRIRCARKTPNETL